MNKEEYLKAKKALVEEFESKKKQIDKEFAFSNNPVKIGDIVTDNGKTIRVEKLLWHYPFMSKYPCMLYIGIRLTKTCNISKRYLFDNKVSQYNIIDINGKTYKYEI